MTLNTMSKRKAGRPRVANARNVNAVIRFSEKEMEQLRVKAKKNNITVSELVRSAVLK